MTPQSLPSTSQPRRFRRPCHHQSSNKSGTSCSTTKMTASITKTLSPTRVRRGSRPTIPSRPTGRLKSTVDWSGSWVRRLCMIIMGPLLRLTPTADIAIVTLTMCIYVSSYIDRGNLGNARLMGLEKDVLDNNDQKYSIALICFYITYLAFALPGTLAAKYVLPSTSIGIGCAIWSLGATCMAATKNPAGVYTARLFVGIGEAMFGQAVPLYFSYWYTKKEIAKRLALYISAGALAGAFGGLIAFGVASIPNPAIPAWRCLFLSEWLVLARRD